ncbi:hypothetical protein ACFFTM_10290 [Pseudoduganella plicata]|uniref:DUF4145 domain-containing protein n=1 Tax=Pseudoduganella plicata TaxID=321984 RepID=A0A4P7BDY0_9BURK|nr:hypothetical protein [Pseudoduganella plicata]QBQ36157.1 hypothetical protein E1742_08310 [Pseudoduganella plicata]GGY77650.1 hypothetical protein GCM10007388_08060 [Pseudoduganella plicata]
MVFQVYAVCGALIGILALACYFLRHLELNLTATDVTILVTAGIGLATSTLSIVYLVLVRARTRALVCGDGYVLAASKFLSGWARFEETGRAKLTQLRIDFNRASIRDLIAHLHDLGLICRADGDTLNEALRLRDEIVHGGALADRRRIEHLASLIDEITRRVKTVTTVREHEPAARDH